MPLKPNDTHPQDTGEELLRTARLLETLLKIESGILRAESPKDVADVALANVEMIIPFSSAAVTLFQSGYREAVILTSHNLSVEPGFTAPAAAGEVAARKRGEPLLIDDIDAVPVKSTALQLVREGGGRSLLSVPLLAQGELIGNLSLIDENPGAFSQEDAAIAQQVGNSVAIAIHNAQLLEKEKKARQEADTLRGVASIISAGMRQEELLDLILRELKRVLAFDRASILLSEGDRFGVAAFQGREMHVPERVLRQEEMPHYIRGVITEQRPMLVANTADDPHWKPQPETAFIGSWMGIPLITNDSLLGLLLLGKTEPFAYSEDDTALAVAFANHAVIAIENARLYREIRQYATSLETQVADRTRDLAALYEISAIAGGHLALEETLDQILGVLIDTLGCTASSIHILDEVGTTLHLEAQRELAPSMLAFLQELPVSHPQMKEVLENKDAVMYSTGSLEQGLSNIPLPDTFSYGVSTAIRAKKKDLGVLGVGYERRQPPTREDVALITSIADSIGVAIENARLRERSKQLAVLNERERLARELHDSATQSLFTMTLFAGAAREHLDAGEYEAVREQLVELEETSVQTHKDMRLLLHELQPDILAEEGLEEALRQRLQMVESRSGIRGDIHAEIPAIVPFAVQEAFFLVAIEALNNTLKHSRASKVTIDIQEEEGYIEMCVSDDGRGFSPIDGKFTIGLGMNNMRQRLEDVRGTLRYESEPQTGTRVIARAPIATQHEPS